ncbi:MAG: FAD-dependent oxidoreductase [Woeseiaceae bacterium]|nr:FAD-dependent oxidoreductase [Woeseiaceae bacterium]
MHVAVLGAGVVGVTTAHFLAEAGHDVTVVEKATGVAEACSHANGAQLSYSYTDAMASPSFLLRMPGLLAGNDAAIRVRPPLDRDLLQWGLAFLAQCSRSKAAANMLANLELASRSAQLLRELRNLLPSDFHYREAGKLVLLRTARELDDARRASDIKAELGIRASVITIAEAADIEPAIAYMNGPYAGAVYSPGDDVGDAREFAALVAERLDHKGHTRFQFETEVLGFVRESNAIRGVKTSHGDLEADATVVCLGAWSPGLLKDVGVTAPINPARGYSVTLPPGSRMPSASVTDFGRRFVISRLGEKVRIAGFADFVGFSTVKDEARIEQLMAIARNTAPEAADYACPEINPWGGNRPLTPDGRPLVGPTHLDGLFLNTGHGSLGWTLACATAEQLTSAVSGEASSNQPRRTQYPSASPFPAETSSSRPG